MADKKIKDPIYGYVYIPENIINSIIDTAQFQRLKNIVQTSYSSLYPSSLHNRFVHSLGVFHLGCIASESVRRSADESSQKIIEKYLSTFRTACLLHDVGHAPFSHTGEYFYLKGGSREQLHKELQGLINDNEIEEEIVECGYKAAPHELMSAIIGLEMYGNNIDDDNKSFFARCITGYKYSNKRDSEKDIQNCFIELLNSRILDVDKIDYLIRDAYMSGFETVILDYERLLKNVFFGIYEDRYNIVFKKAALSVFENVVFANDLERRWIQAHPAVVYESYLINKIMERIISTWFSKYNYLPREILSLDGVGIPRYGRVILGSDADIIYLMKNLKQDDIVTEYIDRQKRKHPLWKTEAEFQAIFDGQSTIIDSLEEVLHMMYHNQSASAIEINQDRLQQIEKDISEMSSAAKSDELYQDNYESLSRQRDLIKVFEAYSKEQGIPFDFVVLYTNQFNSGFRKQEFGDMLFELPTIQKKCRFSEVNNTFSQNNSNRERFFYIYCSRKSDNTVPSLGALIDALMKFGGQLNAKKMSEKVR